MYKIQQVCGSALLQNPKVEKNLRRGKQSMRAKLKSVSEIPSALKITKEIIHDVMAPVGDFK